MTILDRAASALTRLWLDVPPRAPGAYIDDVPPTYPESQHQLISRRASKASRTHFPHSLIGQLRPMVALACPTADMTSPLRRHICLILRVRPQPQVRRIDACSIVPSGAVVADIQPIGNWPAQHHPRHPVRVHMHTVDAELAVPGWLAAACPHPTRRLVFAAVNLRPEVLDLPWGKLGVHSTLQSLTATGRDVRSVAGPFALPSFYPIGAAA